ncbi:MAG: ABC transporter substrate-binding protein [Thiotrichales bacterium]|nr:ABC transporter substrate-binding protein [Thiotrichales bacterium]
MSTPDFTPHSMREFAKRFRLAGFVALLVAFASHGAAGAPYVETPSLADRVASGALPAVERRLPARPSVVAFAGDDLAPGRHGGELRLLMGRAKDVRLMVVYGYARLVGYDRVYRLVPDILEDLEVEEGRIFTLRLRPGHRWSDGHPFTAEDFRYYWEDIATNESLAPFGPPRAYLVEGEPPHFEVLDAHTVRYTWARPNPFFLPALAGARPEPLYAPAHYLRAFHARYADETALNRLAKEEGKRNWAPVHTNRFRPYKNTNPDLPSLQPWVNTTAPPSQRFVSVRNPYFHRVDTNGRQLPYIDRVVVNIADGKLVPAKTGAGESDLQARHLTFNDYTFLKQGEARNAKRVRLWETTRGAHVALYPNLNVEDAGWRALLRDVRFRRALSLAIDRHEINQVIYFGLATEGNDTVHAKGPLYEEDYRTRWARFDLDAANALLDEMGLVERDDAGIRRMPDGRPLEIIVETAGEDTEQTDVLELIGWTWKEAGIKLFSKPLQREVFRNRIASGQTVISVWGGLENGLPLPDMSPRDLAPTRHDQYQWPRWGQFYETAGESGEAPALAPARELAELNRRWLSAPDTDARRAIWERMLRIRADNAFSIGIVSGVPQPVVVDARLRNVPAQGIYNWDPGAHFGIYRPDTFWFED